MTPKTKKDNSNNNKHYFGALLENMDSKIDAILEDRQTLNQKIDRNHQEFKEFQKEVDYKFEAVFERFNVIESELKIINNKLDQKADKTDFIFLEKRVTVLENRSV